MRTLDLGRRFGGIVAWDSFFHLTADEQRALIPRLAGHLLPGRRLAFHRRPRRRRGLGQRRRRAGLAREPLARGLRGRARGERPPSPRLSRRGSRLRRPLCLARPPPGLAGGIGHRRASAPPPEPGLRRVSGRPETWPVAPVLPRQSRRLCWKSRARLARVAPKARTGGKIRAEEAVTKGRPA